MSTLVPGYPVFLTAGSEDSTADTGTAKMLLKLTGLPVINDSVTANLWKSDRTAAGTGALTYTALGGDATAANFATGLSAAITTLLSGDAPGWGARISGAATLDGAGGISIPFTSADAFGRFYLTFSAVSNLNAVLRLPFTGTPATDDTISIVLKTHAAAAVGTALTYTALIADDTAAKVAAKVKIALDTKRAADPSGWGAAVAAGVVTTAQLNIPVKGSLAAGGYYVEVTIVTGGTLAVTGGAHIDSLASTLAITSGDKVGEADVFTSAKTVTVTPVGTHPVSFEGNVMTLYNGRKTNVQSRQATRFRRLGLVA